jgi:glycosyltransferase involved in cell wall biosynthesis
LRCLLYIGNFLGGNIGYYSGPNAWVVSTLKRLGYSIKFTSTSINKIKRAIDFLLLVLSNRKNADMVLIDTYSTSAFYFAYWVSFLCLKLKLRYSLVLHGGNLPSRFERSIILSKKMLENAYAIISPSRYLEQAVIERKLGQPIVIPNPIEIENYKYSKRNFSIPILIWVRSIQEIYNPILALKVLAILKEKYDKVYLYMVGPDNNNMMRELMDFVKLNSLENNIEFTGRLSLQAWTTLSEKANVFINTTNVDNTPVSVLEAMTLGLPVVSTNVGGVPYIIDHKINGLLCEQNNEHDMASKIDELITNHELANSICKNARSLILSKYDSKIVSVLWQEFIENSKF